MKTIIFLFLCLFQMQRIVECPFKYNCCNNNLIFVTSQNINYFHQKYEYFENSNILAYGRNSKNEFQKYVIPKKNLLCPNNCKYNDICTTHSPNCNIGGLRCPYGCNFNGKKCVSTDINKYKCKLTYSHKCPIGCHINNKSCVPKYNNIVCKFVNTTLFCPLACIYNKYTNTCITNSDNVVCKYEEKGIYCPNNCLLNDKGDKCFTTNKDSLCDESIIPICANNCFWSHQKQKCMSNNIKNICEPIIKLECPKYYDYIYEDKYENCTVANIDKPCLVNNILQFPKRLENTIGEYKCSYQSDYSFYSRKIKQCPFPSILNEIQNKCYFKNKNIIFSDVGYMHKPIDCSPANFYNNVCNCCDENKINKNIYKCVDCFYDYLLINVTVNNKLIPICINKQFNDHMIN